MTQYHKFVGLDVHKSSIAIAVAEEGREPPRFLGTTANDLTRLLRKLRKLGPPEHLEVCFEAGPTGYGLQRQLREQGYDCRVVAPARTPRAPADRVKTDRRDAERLAHFLRSGDLSFVRVPTPEEESMRNLLRAREDARRARHKARQQLNMFLLRSGRIWSGRSRWTRAHLLWVGAQKFEREADRRVLADYVHEVERLTERLATFDKHIEELAPELEVYSLIQSLQAFRGIQLLMATWIVVELGDLRRFPTPKHLMSFLGLTPSECSTGDSRSQGRITKAGNIRLRSLLMQAGWAYRLKPRVEGHLRRRNQAATQRVRDIAWKCQVRLHGKLYRLTARGKPKNMALVAVARELAGFIWDVGQQEELYPQAA